MMKKVNSERRMWEGKRETERRWVEERTKGKRRK